LTGGVGSGKSTVAEMLRELGATVIDADQAAHEVYAPGTPGFEAVVAEFGPDFVRDGVIDRQKLGAVVFKDEAARRRLNAIVHPLVREWMAARTAEAFERGAEIVIQDVPLLFENGLEGLFSSVLLVYAPEDVQLQRLMQGRGVARDRAAQGRPVQAQGWARGASQRQGAGVSSRTDQSLHLRGAEGLAGRRGEACPSKLRGNLSEGPCLACLRGSPRKPLGLADHFGAGHGVTLPPLNAPPLLPRHAVPGCLELRNKVRLLELRYCPEDLPYQVLRRGVSSEGVGVIRSDQREALFSE